MIQCANVYKSFADKTVLSGVNFDIPAGKYSNYLVRQVPENHSHQNIDGAAFL